jgi:hypothetical protein
MVIEARKRTVGNQTVEKRTSKDGKKRKLPKPKGLFVGGLLDAALSIAYGAANDYSGVRFRGMLDGLHASAITGFTFYFV